MKKICAIFWLGFISLFLLTAQVSAQESIFDVSSPSLFSNDDEFLPLDEAFQFNFHQEGNRVNVTFDIAEGYYLYRHQFKFKTEEASISDVVLPTGEDHEDEYFGVQKIFTGHLAFNIDVESTQENPIVTVRYQGCAEKGLCYAPAKQTIYLNQYNDNLQTTTSSNNTSENKSEQHQLADMLKQDSLWLTLVAFFIGGLLLSFTPCVFPMYPILTGIIVGQGNKLTTKKAFTLSFFYVQGMAVTYTILGIVVALAGAQFQAAFQHPIVLIGLSVLFIFLALSMFGVFNLALPSSWQNKLNDMSNNQKGGSVIGVISMGIISGLVASPCTTAPLTGALLYISQTGDIVLGASALYALSLGMGLPLLILGSSGGKLLPKAGAWMNVIKNIFGLLLLAVPIFLLERMVPALVIQILWITLLLSTATYFYVTNKSTPVNFWHGVRSLFIFLALFYGAMQAYKLIDTTPVSSTQVSTSSTNEEQGAQQAHAENKFVMVASLKELEAKVKEANAAGKTVMVDLYADWCIACKEFEHYTFSAPIVKEALKNTVLIQIDLTDTSSDSSVELMDKFQVFGLPSILFFNTNGDELTQNRVTGFMDAKDFSALVKKIL
ncbi:protein-disulfide reductase DsbD [Pseudocolwellia agarivorans]|uniref:protein-disulfide reductase DsbD n=1 Tax=Pseudocolwellia agarivorans TaxID=1911682 RepID=UPI000985927F|nr:protein-disulfide reductase DsbD [Pseudocolwellia agarivorans]